MAFPTIADITETASGAVNQTNHIINLPATVNANDLLIVSISVRGGQTLTGPGGNWNELWTSTGKGCWSLLAVGDEDGGTITIQSSLADRSAAQVIRINASTWFQDDTQGNGLDIGTVATQSSQTPDPPSATATWGTLDNLFVTICQGTDDDATVTTYPSGYDDNQDELQSGGGPNGGSEVAVCSKESAASSDNPGTWAWSESESFVMNTIVVRPATTSVPILRRRREFVGAF